MDKELSNVEPVTERETKENMIDAAVIDMDKELSNAESVNEQEPEVNMIGSFSAPVAESTQEEPQEGLEHSEDEPEAENKAPDNEKQEQPKAKDDIFDMFKDEMVEESETSKFAANLASVDVHDLLDDAQNLANDLSKARG